MENQMLPSEEVVFLLKRLDELFAQMIVENDEQKAEIERLTEENGYLDGCAKQFLADYKKCEIERAELQKQVDKAWFEVGKMCMEERKATAKEIFDSIFEVLCSFTTQGKSKEYNEGYIDCLAEVDKRLQNLAKSKGAEVE